MDDLRSAEVDFLTIGQYLQPSVKHHPLNRYYHPDEFKELENIAKSKTDIGWGHQIRSYVLHPYKLIKDLRSGYETSNVNEILDGKIDNFLENSLTLKTL